MSKKELIEGAFKYLNPRTECLCSCSKCFAHIENNSERIKCTSFLGIPYVTNVTDPLLIAALKTHAIQFLIENGAIY